MVKHLASMDWVFPASIHRFVVAPQRYLFGLVRMAQLLAERPEEALSPSQRRSAHNSGVVSAKFEPIILELPDANR